MSSRSTARPRPHLASPLRIGVALVATAAFAAVAPSVVQRARVNDWIEAGALPEAAPDIPSSAAVSLTLAQERAATKDWKGATELAAAALARSPLDAGIVRILGLSAEVRRAPEVAQWLALGGQLGWRDLPMQLWQVGKAAEYGDLDTLVARADALLRQDGSNETVLPLMRLAAGLPEGAQLVAQRLAAGPHWRRLYFTDYKEFSSAQMPGHEAVLYALRKTDLPPTRAELASYLRTLIGLNEPQRAVTIWSRLSGRSRSPGNPVFDGGFTAAREYPPEEVIPFEWNLLNGAGAGAATELAGRNPVLVAQTDGSALTLVASQLLVLSPGAYRFSVDVRSPVNAPDKMGFAWGFSCLPGGRRIYPDLAPRLESGGDARSLSFTFVVPGGCPAQRLELRSTGLSPPMSTEARFDDVRITRGG